jgi:hypothetical protein
MPTGDENNLLGSGALGIRPFAAVSASLGALSPHANVSYQWNGKSALAGNVRTGEKADLPDQFMYAAGGDIVIADRLSIVFDVLGQRVVDSPRILSRVTSRTGPADSVTLPDILFVTESYWTSAAAFGMKGNLAPQLLVTFNLRFATADGGLTDRVTPLVGMEWAF